MKPIVRKLEDQLWDAWPDSQQAERGALRWRDLFAGNPEDGANTTLGIATLRCGETLEPHRHSEPETYYTLAGRGIVTIDGVPHPVAPGTAIYIPGDAEHGIRNDYDEELQILYVFAVSDFNQVVYRF
jgi:quercetin dioxygenase-like cupin family protein